MWVALPAMIYLWIAGRTISLIMLVFLHVVMLYRVDPAIYGEIETGGSFYGSIAIILG